MAQADSSTGKELLKYEVQDIQKSLPFSNSPINEREPPSSKGRVTLLSLICRLLDNLLYMQKPSLEAMGLCLSICASMATHAPGEVVAQLMATELFDTSKNIPLFIDNTALESSVTIKARMEDSIKSGLPRFQLLHQEHECREQVYAVTEGLLEVLATALYKGVTTGMIAEATGWILVHTLGKHRNWAYKVPAQQHYLAELCVRTIRRGLQCVTSAARHARSNEEVDHRIAFVSALESLIAGPLVHVIPAAFPPPAVVLEEGRVSSSNLVVIKAVESLAKEILATVPAMDQSQETLEQLFFRSGGEQYGASCLSSYLTYSHSDLKMRLLALQAIKIFLEVIAGQLPNNRSKLTYKDLVVKDGMRGVEGNHGLWRNTLVQSTGLVMAGIDAQVCCAALDCVKWTLANHFPLMQTVLFPTLLQNNSESSSGGPIMPWARKTPKTGQPSSPGGTYALPDSPMGRDSPAPRSGAHELMPLGRSTFGKSQRGGGPSTSEQMSTSTLSVLDCAWDLLQDAPRLLKEKPQPVASTLQLIAALIQSSHLSPKHKEAVEILKGQAGFWHCISACVPQRPAPESDHEPERSQYLAEQAALQCMAIELGNFRKNHADYSRTNLKDLLIIVKDWEREGWRGRSARMNQVLMEREGTTIQEMETHMPTAILARTVCNPSRSCVCLGFIVMILIIIVIFQRQSV
uniref:Uncharacterized protein n=2 Tax=Tetraselmis chuii TaxID=63592 RepID=A0A7S1T072_9CHLO